MRDLVLLSTRKQAREYIWSEIITQPEIQNHRFYQQLVEFIIDQRAPLFFHASDPTRERSHFTQWLNLFLIRDEYENRYIRDLYFIHDMIHILFPYSFFPARLTRKEYAQQTRLFERVAANDSEVLTYYRLPRIRKKTFSEPIWFDWLKEKLDHQPSSAELLSLRESLVENEFLRKLLFYEEKWQPVKAFLGRFQSSDAWANQWQAGFPHLSCDFLASTLSLDPYRYEDQLMNYEPDYSGKTYQNTQEKNLQLWSELATHESSTPLLLTTKKSVKQLEGRILLSALTKEEIPT